MQGNWWQHNQDPKRHDLQQRHSKKLSVLRSRSIGIIHTASEVPVSKCYLWRTTHCYYIIKGDSYRDHIIDLK